MKFIARDRWQFSTIKNDALEVGIVNVGIEIGTKYGKVKAKDILPS